MTQEIARVSQLCLCPSHFLMQAVATGGSGGPLVCCDGVAMMGSLVEARHAC